MWSTIPMPQLPVVAVLLSPSDGSFILYRPWQFLSLLAVLFSTVVFAQDTAAPRYVADIELQTEADLDELLSRAEQLLVQGDVAQGETAAVTLVLHGPVLRALLKPNYLKSKKTVDLAASLSALGIVEFKACRSWLGENELDEAQLQPFVSTVSFGPAEVGRLVREQGYIYF